MSELLDGEGLAWSEQRWVITGSDILGRLLRGATSASIKLATA